MYVVGIVVERVHTRVSSCTSVMLVEFADAVRNALVRGINGAAIVVSEALEIAFAQASKTVECS